MEIHEQLGVRELRGEPVGGADRQSRLADARHAVDRGDRDAAGRDGGEDLVEVLGTAREVRDVTGQVVAGLGPVVGREHLLVSLLQVLAGVEAELVGEPGTDVAVGLQRLGLPVAPVQREDQLSPQPFSHRVVQGQRAQFRDELRVPAHAQITVDPRFQNREVLLGQRGHVVAFQRIAADVRERPATPQLESLVRFQRLETVHVDLVGPHVQQVAAGPGPHQVRHTEVLAQPPDRGLQGVARPADQLGQFVDPDHLAGTQQQRGEHDAPLTGRDVDVAPVEHHVQRPEQAERPHFH